METGPKVDRYENCRLIYSQLPPQEPRRYEIIKYSTWRMRLYQELESTTHEELLKQSTVSLNQIFPRLCRSAEQTIFYQDFMNQHTTSFYQELVSHFICRMLYSRQLKNHDTFIKLERMILALRLEKVKNSISRMDLLKTLVSKLASLPLEDLNVSEEEYKVFQQKINRRGDSKNNNNAKSFMKVPFEYAEYGLKKRKCFVRKGFVYIDWSVSVDTVLGLYSSYLKENLLKIRGAAEKFLENDIQNQIKPYMDKAISSLNVSTVEESELNTDFKLTLKNVDSVAKQYFPPCMLHLTKKLKENNHLKHDGRRQLWLFFKACGMNVHDNKEYFHRHLSVKVSNSQLKSHMYNIQHAYGLVGKKQPERAKICRAIITGPEPKKDQHHGCPFRHWGNEALKTFLNANYSITEPQMKEIMEAKTQKSDMVACGRLFEVKFKSGKEDLPLQITKELGKSPQQFFFAGMAATEWINHKTLRPMKEKPAQNEKMELQF